MDISQITRPLLTNPVTKYPAAVLLFPPTFLFLMARMLYRVFIKYQGPGVTCPTCYGNVQDHADDEYEMQDGRAVFLQCRRGGATA